MFRGFWRGLEIKCLISIQHFTASCNYGSAISQLSVLASHKTNFESSSRRLGIRGLAIWEVPFFE